MSNRREGATRVWSFLWAVFVASLIAAFVVLFGVVYGAIDVIWQIFTGRDGLNKRSRSATLIVNVLKWELYLFLYAFTGAKEFRWLPPTSQGYYKRR